MKRHFKNKTVGETKDIIAFYEQTEKNIKQTTINWRVHMLVKSGFMQRIGRGKFAFGETKNYIPEISTETRKLFKKLKAEFPYANLCVWNTSILNEFMQHQPNHFFVLVHCGRTGSNNNLYSLRETKKSVFIAPTRDILDKYIVIEKDVCIVNPLISEAPTQNILGIETATIEKILVDIFCDNVIFSTQQGAEMRTIFQAAFDKYTINQSKMLRYAARRKKKKELNEFVKTISNLWQ